MNFETLIQEQARTDVGEAFKAIELHFIGAIRALKDKESRFVKVDPEYPENIICNIRISEVYEYLKEEILVYQANIHACDLRKKLKGRLTDLLK